MRVASILLMGLGLAASPALAAGQGEGFSAAELLRTLGLLTAVIGVVGLILIEFVFKGKLSRSLYNRLLLLGLLAIPVVVMLGATETVFEETKSVASCGSCHVMEPFINDMQNPSSASLAARHYKNKWIADHQCYECHTTYGVHGTLSAKRDGFRHWLLYVTGTWDEPIQYSGSYPNGNCMSCHVGTSAFQRVNAHAALRNDLESDAVSCATCHGPPHPTPTERPELTTLSAHE